MSLKTLNNQDNPFRFDDDKLIKTSPTPPKWGKALMCLRLAVLVLSAIILLVPYLIFYRGGNLVGVRNGGFWVLRLWGRICVWSFGLKLDIHGKAMKHGGALIANHISPFDTFVLFAAFGGYMMPKSEVRAWPVMGWFTTLSGAQYLERNRAKAKQSVAEMSERVGKGDVMVFHPEGTTTDGQRLLPFRPTLFQSLVDLDATAYVQPVTLVYHAPAGASDNFYGWWGTASFFGYIAEACALPGRRVIEVHFGVPIEVIGTRQEVAQKSRAEMEATFKARLKARQVPWTGD